jgi:protein TonB
MRFTSSAVSLVVHGAVVAASVWGTAVGAPRTRPQPPIVLIDNYPDNAAGPEPTLPPAPRLPDGVLPDGRIPINIPWTVPDGLTPARITFDVGALPGKLLARSYGTAGDPIDVLLAEEAPAILAGPLPAYPELLRQAGIEGRVVLEAVVDTLGRVEPRSIVAVTAGHPGFVAPAQRALAATLFRPARVHGRAVRVRVRVPIDFRLRG